MKKKRLLPLGILAVLVLATLIYTLSLIHI